MSFVGVWVFGRKNRRSKSGGFLCGWVGGWWWWWWWWAEQKGCWGSGVDKLTARVCVRAQAELVRQTAKFVYCIAWGG